MNAAEQDTLARMLRTVADVAPRCTGKENQCNARAVGVIVAPKTDTDDGGPVPGGYSCDPCAHEILTEYRDKINERWLFVTPPQNPGPVYHVPVEGGNHAWRRLLYVEDARHDLMENQETPDEAVERQRTASQDRPGEASPNTLDHLDPGKVRELIAAARDLIAVTEDNNHLDDNDREDSSAEEARLSAALEPFDDVEV